MCVRESRTETQQQWQSWKKEWESETWQDKFNPSILPFCYCFKSDCFVFFPPFPFWHPVKCMIPHSTALKIHNRIKKPLYTHKIGWEKKVAVPAIHFPYRLFYTVTGNLEITHPLEAIWRYTPPGRATSPSQGAHTLQTISPQAYNACLWIGSGNWRTWWKPPKLREFGKMRESNHQPRRCKSTMITKSSISVMLSYTILMGVVYSRMTPPPSTYSQNNSMWWG